MFDTTQDREYAEQFASTAEGVYTNKLQAIRCALIADPQMCYGSWWKKSPNGAQGGCLYSAAYLATTYGKTRTNKGSFYVRLKDMLKDVAGIAESWAHRDGDSTAVSEMIDAYDGWMKYRANHRRNSKVEQYNGAWITEHDRVDMINIIEKELLSRVEGKIKKRPVKLYECKAAADLNWVKEAFVGV